MKQGLIAGLTLTETQWPLPQSARIKDVYYYTCQKKVLKYRKLYIDTGDSGIFLGGSQSWGSFEKQSKPPKGLIL